MNIQRGDVGTRPYYRWWILEAVRRCDVVNWNRILSAAREARVNLAELFTSRSWRSLRRRLIRGPRR